MMIAVILISSATALEKTYDFGKATQWGQAWSYTLEKDQNTYLGATRFYIDYNKEIKEPIVLCQCEQTSSNFYHYGGELDCHKEEVTEKGFIGICRSKTSKLFRDNNNNLYVPKDIIIDWHVLGYKKENTRLFKPS